MIWLGRLNSHQDLEYPNWNISRKTYEDLKQILKNLPN